MTTIDEREALTLAKNWLQYGEHGLANAIAVLTKAAEQARSQTVCAECGGPILGEPVIDPEARAWLGEGADAYCSLVCIEAHNEARINAYGNGAS
jgi:hypothetical protein